MPRILSVGQCGFDQFGISRKLKSAFGAEVASVDTTVEALAMIRDQRFDLVLINRVFDADGGSGLDLIRTIKADPALSPTPAMLVSNYPEAQRQAEELGALPGFGKSEIRSTAVIERLAAALKPRHAPSPES